MAFNLKNHKSPNQVPERAPEVVVDTPPEIVKDNQDNLTVEEIQLILQLIRDTSFKGEYVEIVYNMTLKLQNQYNTLQNKK